jgi:tetratricopeptide (TPR) repeat protein
LFRKSLKHASAVAEAELDYTDIYLEQAYALVGLASCQLNQSHPEQALLTCINALRRLEEGISRGPRAGALHNYSGVVHRKLGAIHRILGNHDQAVQEFHLALRSHDHARVNSRISASLVEKSTTWRELGNLLKAKSDAEGADHAYRAANKSARSAVELGLHSRAAYRASLLAEIALATLEQQRSNPENALRLYRSASRIASAGLRRYPGELLVRFHLGECLKASGLINRQMGRIGSARRFYKQSHRIFNEGLSAAPNHPDLNSGKAQVLEQMIFLLTRNGDRPESFKYYDDILETLERQISFAPENVYAQRRLALYLKSAGDAYVRAARINTGRTLFDRAIAISNGLLEAEGRDYSASLALVGSLVAIGLIHLRTGNREEAWAALRQGIIAARSANPTDLGQSRLRVLWADCERHLGALHQSYSQYTEAETEFMESIEIAKQGLVSSPKDILLNEALCNGLNTLGSLQRIRSEWSFALASFSEMRSVATFTASTHPTERVGAMQLGDSWNLTGQVYSDTESWEQAIDAYRKALVEYERAPRLSFMLQLSKGQARRRLGAALTEVCEFDEASKLLRLAITTYSRMLRRGADNPSLLNSLAYARLHLAISLHQRGKHALSKALAAKAETDVERCLALAPTNFIYLLTRSEILHHRALIAIKQKTPAEARSFIEEAVSLCDAVLAESPDRLPTLKVKAQILLSYAQLLSAEHDAGTQHSINEAQAVAAKYSSLAPHTPWIARFMNDVENIALT